MVNNGNKIVIMQLLYNCNYFYHLLVVSEYVKHRVNISC